MVLFTATSYFRKKVKNWSMKAFFAIAKIWKQPKCPSTDEWIKKLWCVYVMLLNSVDIFHFLPHVVPE